MDESLISKILIGQVTDLVEKQKTVSPDELAEDIVNSCCYFVLKRRKEAIAANPSPLIMFESISDSIKFAGEITGKFGSVALQLFKNNYSMGSAMLLHDEVLDRILEDDAWERVKQYFWDKHRDNIGN